MSDLIRYNIKPGEDGYEIAVSLGGEWVHYSDYARLQQERVHDLNQIGGLQQELASLRASSFVTAVPVEEYETLNAEVNRLTKLQVEALNERNKAEAEVDCLKDKIEYLTPSIWLRVVAWIVSFVGAFWLAHLVLNWMRR